MSKQSMTVGTRLALGFGLVLALMAGVSGLGIYNMHRIHAQLEKIVQLNVAKLTYVQDMSEAVHIVARVTRTLVLLSDEAAMRRELPKIQAARAQYDKAQAALEALPGSGREGDPGPHPRIAAGSPPADRPVAATVAAAQGRGSDGPANAEGRPGHTALAGRHG